MPKLPKLVILERDGVINENHGEPIYAPADWVAIPDSLEAIARLNHAGVSVAVASNQPGIGLELFTIDDLNAIHVKFQRALARVGGHIDGFFFCPHRVEDCCDCRKPAPGLLRTISLRFGLPLNNVPCIGVSKQDVDAAHSARARPMLVRTGEGRNTLEIHPELAHLPCFKNLNEAVGAMFEAGGER